MSREIKVPSIGESINEVTLSSWIKQDGAIVEMDEVIAEIESDKASFEITAEVAGKLLIKAQEDETLAIGDVLCEIDENQAGVEKEIIPPISEPSASHSTGEIVEMTVPEVGESITEVTIAQWIKGNGDLVEIDEIIAEIESDKATLELPSQAHGKLHIIAQEGETLQIGALICKIEVTEKEKTSNEPTSVSAPPPLSSTHYAKGHASPAASKILSEKGISPDAITGTGKDGRIIKEDVLKTEKHSISLNKEVNTTTSPLLTANRSQQTKKMSSLRKTIARRLVAVKNETAMLTTFNEVDMQSIMDLRKKYKEKFKEKYEVNLGFMSFFTKACCIALQEWPTVNAKINDSEIIYSDYCDISIAVSTPKGLVVPVVKNAEQMSFDEIEKEIIKLATKARENKLSIEEMQGGTFTITNGGVFGSMMSTPIINAPQSAILGMHNIIQRPVVENGEIVIRPMMYLALSYDHRIIDGKESVSFLVRVKQLLEDPTRLLLEI